ncbi:sensor domain-containing protein [Mycolicibacterium palauense]|uniref:sensor domain-containing protein n=1 Tax=Mycolicibacterium palauense TaxID=2034511 RepID=UPI00159BCF23|nr:sensor domain-containing protein [Mycolicibacterium palauense]
MTGTSRTTQTTRALWVVAGLAVLAVLAGCARTTDGSVSVTRTADQTSVPVQPEKIDSPLTAYLLDAAEVNRILNATGMTLVGAANAMADEYTATTRPECLGALLNGAESVYDGTGWTDVVDQVFAEPEANSAHWAEQTIVAFESRERASDFYQSSVQQWTNCIGEEVVVTDGESDFSWRLEGITVADGIVSQTASQTDSGGWQCRHALTAVSSYVVEAATCGSPAGPEAADLARSIAERIE